MTKILTFTAALIIAGGGPGFRGPDGKCQSWDRVQPVCGLDGSRCQRERVNPLFPKLDSPAQAYGMCARYA